MTLAIKITPILTIKVNLIISFLICFVGNIKLFLKNANDGFKNNRANIPIVASIDSSDSSLRVQKNTIQELDQYHEFVIKTFEKLQKSTSKNSDETVWLHRIIRDLLDKRYQ